MQEKVSRKAHIINFFPGQDVPGPPERIMPAVIMGMAMPGLRLPTGLESLKLVFLRFNLKSNSAYKHLIRNIFSCPRGGAFAAISCAPHGGAFVAFYRLSKVIPTYILRWGRGVYFDWCINSIDVQVTL